MAHDVSLAYPDFNAELKIHTDARKFQLWSVILHNVKRIDFYSIKLMHAQKSMQ